MMDAAGPSRHRILDIYKFETPNSKAQGWGCGPAVEPLRVTHNSMGHSKAMSSKKFTPKIHRTTGEEGGATAVGDMIYERRRSKK